MFLSAFETIRNYGLDQIPDSLLREKISSKRAILEIMLVLEYK